MFPTESAQFQLIAAIAERNNSGAEVPIAIIVNQMIRLETRKYLAILTLELIR